MFYQKTVIADLPRFLELLNETGNYGQRLAASSRETLPMLGLPNRYTRCPQPQISWLNDQSIGQRVAAQRTGENAETTPSCNKNAGASSMVLLLW